MMASRWCPISSAASSGFGDSGTGARKATRCRTRSRGPGGDSSARMRSMNDTQSIQITDDSPSDEQLALAFKQACSEFGDCVADYENEEFTKEFHDQLNTILTEAALDGLIEKGLATSMVRDDGQIGYILTQLGRDVSDEAILA